MKILFQGDSITDAGRIYDDIASMGTGYPLLVKSELGYEDPMLEFVNKGISGNRIVDLYARIKADIINIKPDYMSILIGVNDVWHELFGNGVCAEKFYKIYDMLIEEIKAELPNTTIVIFGPYVLKGSATEEYWDMFYTEVPKRAKKAELIAEKYGLKYVSLQDKFDEAAKKAPNDYWLFDGVHPTPMGHQIIKNEWIKAFKELNK